MLEAMTARERWVYAVPPEGAREHASRALEPLGLTKTPGDAQDRYERAGATVLVAEAPDLDVAFVVASGPEAPEALGAVLEATGFFAQSTLLASAHDVDAPETSSALRTLAPMVAAWDARWADLFALHLGAAEPSVRAMAAAAIAVAAQAADASAPAREKLEAALAIEADAEVADAMRAALATF
jgi:hypothetical protein